LFGKTEQKKNRYSFAIQFLVFFTIPFLEKIPILDN
jgi:hypothetical protein